jgi:hypothetical protein
VDGSKGTVLVGGETASMPNTITIIRKTEGSGQDMGNKKAGEKRDAVLRKRC